MRFNPCKGAADFDLVVHGTTVGHAFNLATADAIGEHGSDGYSGTIADKDDYRLFDLPAGVSADAVTQALGNSDVEALAAWYGREQADGLYKTYTNTWGPAVCLPAGGGAWRFCGLATF